MRKMVPWWLLNHFAFLLSALPAEGTHDSPAAGRTRVGVRGKACALVSRRGQRARRTARHGTARRGRRGVSRTVEEVVGAPVVLGVGDLPRVVGREQEGVYDEADGVVDGLRRGEAAVAALVREHPQARAEEPRVEPVGGPRQQHRPARQVLLREENQADRAGDERNVLKEVVEGRHIAGVGRGSRGAARVSGRCAEASRTRRGARRGQPGARTSARSSPSGWRP